MTSLPPKRGAAGVFAVVVIAAIMAGTSLAFFVTERAKLRRPLVTDTAVDKQFSPSCRCRRQVARIAFRLPGAARITVQIVNAAGQPVTTLVRDRLLSSGLKKFEWRGRSARGRVLPDGAYRPQVIFTRQHRRLVLPSPIELDTTRPRLEHYSARIRGRRIALQYVFSEPAQAMLLVDGRLAELKRLSLSAGRLTWAGIFPNGHAAARGPHRILLVGVDLAGNRSRRPRGFIVRLR
jgi:FlgD Ig-like domain